MSFEPLNKVNYRNSNELLWTRNNNSIAILVTINITVNLHVTSDDFVSGPLLPSVYLNNNNNNNFRYKDVLLTIF